MLKNLLNHFIFSFQSISKRFIHLQFILQNVLLHTCLLLFAFRRLKSAFPPTFFIIDMFLKARTSFTFILHHLKFLEIFSLKRRFDGCFELKSGGCVRLGKGDYFESFFFQKRKFEFLFFSPRLHADKKQKLSKHLIDKQEKILSSPSKLIKLAHFTASPAKLNYKVNIFFVYQ